MGGPCGSVCVEREKILSMCVLGKERTSKGMCDFPEKKIGEERAV